MNQSIKHIVIIGGGSAGWLSAGIIASEHKTAADSGVQITLVESPDVQTIGVGEGTWPSMRQTLKKMGISETEFVLNCDASFKQASEFRNWTHGNGDSYFHPFTMPAGFHETNIADFWQQHRQQVSFADATTSQSHICRNGLAPKQISTPEYSFNVNYGYHLDAGKFSTFLQKHCCSKLGVSHVLDHVVKINSHENGDIKSVSTRQHGDIEADLFIDCTGFKSLLLGEHYGIDFISQKHVLFNDRALAVQVPYANDNEPIASHTISTAQSCGWIWDIGLPSRRGIGHVYSSAHISDDAAAAQLREYIRPALGNKADDVALRHIKINPGYRQKFWHKNCVAIGMSAGFIEPLEASALALIELSAKMIAEQLPANRQVMDITAKRFNTKFNHRWLRIIEFLKLHYILSQRDDSQYWRDNRSAKSIPEHLQELMQLWQYQSPYGYDSDHSDDLFPAASFQFVLYGMGFETQLPNRQKRHDKSDMANTFFNDNIKQTQQLMRSLGSNRELINKIKKYGFAKL
ncbi:tryptophan halogenase family protein [Thalassotalea sp. Y01]|uniref:tryptophan halogenase family protein n=1 Tax=Thalassotalea sp. Y01 TaxID=2729613 RepID=UPI00145C4D0D|nr:tryptophan halogenase family protein [Thalassotalea sp. Y01]NMP16373.1 tryptophan 7-halogenase [Thalassotalea sp. Y01]